MGYKLTFAGSGSAFTQTNYQSNAVFWRDEYDGKLLIDCGADARFSLGEIGLTHRDIDAIYISHLHSDHAGGLEWLGFSRLFDPECRRPAMFISRKLVGPLWRTTLVGGMGSLQCKVADLETYFDVQRVSPNQSFWSLGVEFTLVQTIHIYDGFSLRFSFGLLFTIGDRTVYMTTDTQHAPEQISDFYGMADIIFHDCETAAFESGVHAHYNKLRDLPDEVKGKIWLYHYQDGDLPDAEADGFLGFVAKGQTFDLGGSAPHAD